MLNPDGTDYQIHGVQKENPLYERVLGMNGGSTDFSRWQANARGVDLNHNYDAGFWEYKKPEAEGGIFAGATRYSGEAPESEPEVAALCNLVRFEGDLRGILTLHTQGEEIYWHYGDRTPPRSRMMAEVLAASSGYTVASPEGLAAHGGFKDWFIHTFARPGFTLEMGKGRNPLPLSDFEQLYAKAREMLLIAALL
jgi:g-D-glutamyl-meso-diaminopimelate peptidase